MVPITIYKNGELIQKCSSIKEAARWLKQHTEDKFFRFSKIENGYCYGEPWDFNGARFTFEADESDRESRREQLGKRKRK